MKKLLILSIIVGSLFSVIPSASAINSQCCVKQGGLWACGCT